MVAHTILLTLATTTAVIIFLGFAVYVLTHNPNRLLSWLFSLLCFSVANIYLSSLFMVVRPDTLPSLGHFSLSWKWIAITLSATFFLHFVSFYFPVAWRPYRTWILLTVYIVSSGLVLMMGLTDRLLLDHLHPEAPHIIAPAPGPLLISVVGFFTTQLVFGAWGLFASYRTTISRPLRRELFFLFVVTGVVLLGSSIHWIILFTEGGDAIPHELPDALLLAAGLLYLQAIIRHGSVVAQPLARRSLFYRTFSVGLGLIAFYLSLSLDKWLMKYTDYPYPVATGVLVLILAFGLPGIHRRMIAYLDRRLFKADQQQDALVSQVAKALAESPDLEQLQIDLLGSLCAVLGVRDGYIAFSAVEAEAEQLTVQAVQGNLALQPGDIIPSSLTKPPLS
ncbi:MAG: hypothetical protein KDJ97_26855, partial [Anaerolineae bacterium]|nr:hypothetical protein [Anaerolineae bacterium]